MIHSFQLLSLKPVFLSIQKIKIQFADLIPLILYFAHLILYFSEKTVEKHRSRLMTKLDARNLAGLVRIAVKYHLVD